MKTEQIVMENGWNPGFGVGTKVIATRNVWSMKEGDVLTYVGGCDHPEYGWDVRLEGGEPNFWPGETPREVGTHNVSGCVFEHSFRKVK